MLPLASTVTPFCIWHKHLYNAAAWWTCTFLRAKWCTLYLFSHLKGRSCSQFRRHRIWHLPMASLFYLRSIARDISTNSTFLHFYKLTVCALEFATLVKVHCIIQGFLEDFIHANPDATKAPAGFMRNCCEALCNCNCTFVSFCLPVPHTCGQCLFIPQRLVQIL